MFILIFLDPSRVENNGFCEEEPILRGKKTET